MLNPLSMYAVDAVAAIAEVKGGNACRAAMLQENPKSAGESNNCRSSENVQVVPDDVLEALQEVARIRLDLNDFEGDRRGIADCLGDAEEALIEVVNRRAAMLAAAPQEVK